jgi:DNA-directed RNA polymerase subunit M/transcription elongation factor TFIIS
MTISESVTALRNEAERLNLDLQGMDDEDLIIRALAHLENDIEFEFNEVEIESEDGLTREQKDNYLNSPSECPSCHSDHIVAERIEAEGESAWGNVVCQQCGKRWRDIYTLTNIEEI